MSGRRTNLFVLADGLGNHRVGETIGTVKARVAALQPGCAFRLRPVWGAAVPVEAGHAVIARVRRSLARRHLHHDWFRTDCTEVVGALEAAMGEVAGLLERGPAEDGPDDREPARERADLKGRAARKTRGPCDHRPETE